MIGLALRASFLAGAFSLCAGEVIQAQIYTPSFMAPRRSSDAGVYLSDGPGEFAVEGIWRRAFGEFDLGLRGGVADTPDLSVLLGAEYRNPLSIGAPLDLSVTGAVQAVLGGADALGFVAGLTLGHTFTTPGISLTPYIHPRLGAVQGFVGDDLDLELLADIGLDIQAGSNLEVRLGFELEGLGSEWGIGLAW